MLLGSRIRVLASSSSVILSASVSNAGPSICPRTRCMILAANILCSPQTPPPTLTPRPVSDNENYHQASAGCLDGPSLAGQSFFRPGVFAKHRGGRVKPMLRNLLRDQPNLGRSRGWYGDSIPRGNYHNDFALDRCRYFLLRCSRPWLQCTRARFRCPNLDALRYSRVFLRRARVRGRPDWLTLSSKARTYSRTPYSSSGAKSPSWLAWSPRS